MLKKVLLTIPLYLFLGCDYQDFTEIKKSEKESSIEPKISKSSTIRTSVPMLGILVSYDNIEISSDDTFWHTKLFGTEEHQLNSYYKEVSSNHFEFTKVEEDYGIKNDSIVSIHLPKNHPNTDVDSLYFERKVYPDFKTALELVDEYVDFSNYDKNADGYITPDELLITFIIAGYEDAYEGRHVINGIWGHQSCLSATLGEVIVDSVSLLNCEHKGNFAVFGEKHNKDNPHNATIGIIAHELGHSTFNLPDLYSTFNPNEGGIGYFGIMGSGTWATQNSEEYAGNTPAHFCAWSKIYNNWIEPIVVKNEEVTLYETASLKYNILKIPIDTNSYYLLENRNNSGYDRGLYSLEGKFNGGIAIWKIDETKVTKAHIEENDVNNDTVHKGVDLVEAVEGTIDSDGGGGDEKALYYDSNKNHFSTLVTNISQRGSAMTLNLN